MTIHISIARDFSRQPGVRFRTESIFSGEQFREDILESAYLQARERNEDLEVDLDGTGGYSTSFLDESFGGLVRAHRELAEDILARVHLVSSEEPHLIPLTVGYMRDPDGKRGRKKFEAMG